MEQETRIKLIGGVIGAAVVAGLLAATVVSAAAQGRGPGGPGFRHQGGPGGPGGFGRGGFGVNLPSLTEAQRQQIRSVVQSHREEMQSLAARERAARQALQASAESGQVDQGQASELGSATAALAVLRAQTHAEVLQVLTSEQRQELKTRRDAVKQWRDARPRGDDGPGRRGGRGNRAAPQQQ